MDGSRLLEFKTCNQDLTHIPNIPIKLCRYFTNGFYFGGLIMHNISVVSIEQL